MTAIYYGDDSLDLDTTNDSFLLAQTYLDGNIRVEYHPNSGHEPDLFNADGYRQLVPDVDATLEPEPWAPFRTREDFEFAEIALETGMTKGQLEALIKLFHKCIAKEGSFTISNHKDMKNTFDIASNRLAKVL